MRPTILTTGLTLLTLTTPATSLSFPLLAPQPGPFSPPTRNWARGDAKVALPGLNQYHDPKRPGESSSSSNTNTRNGFPTEHKVISNICDANADLEFGKCYRAVKKEVESSVKAYCGVMKGRYEACMRERVERDEEGGCMEAEAEWEGCAGFT